MTRGDTQSRAPRRPPEPDLGIGEMIGDYKILGVLGRGGMGAVYEAVHPLIDKRAAIKIIHRDLCENAESVARFRQEAKLVNQIGHPNIVDVFGLGQTEDGRAYLIMELLVGESLAAWLSPDRAPGLSVQSTCDILVEVTHALEAAHDAGIIHRDLKPDNIFLAQTRGGQTIVKLLDFGIAKLGIGEHTQTAIDYTQPGVFVGTPKYIAPEQARGMPLAGTADIYALGAVAFELLAGRPPFIGVDAVELIAKHVTMQAPLPSVFNPTLPVIADVMCSQMLDKDPSRRPLIGQIRSMLEQLKVAPPRDPHDTIDPAREKQTEIIQMPVPAGHPGAPPPVGNITTVGSAAAIAALPPASTPTSASRVAPAASPSRVRSVDAPIPVETIPDEPSRVPWWVLALVALGVVAFGVWAFGQVLDRNDEVAPGPAKPAATGVVAEPTPLPTITPITPPVTAPAVAPVAAPDAAIEVELTPVDAAAPAVVDTGSGSAALGSAGSAIDIDPVPTPVTTPPPPVTPPVQHPRHPTPRPRPTPHPTPTPTVTPPEPTPEPHHDVTPTPPAPDHVDPPAPKPPKHPKKPTDDDDAIVSPFAHPKP